MEHNNSNNNSDDSNGHKQHWSHDPDHTRSQQRRDNARSGATCPVSSVHVYRRIGAENAACSNPEKSIAEKARWLSRIRSEFGVGNAIFAAGAVKSSFRTRISAGRRVARHIAQYRGEKNADSPDGSRSA